LLFSRKNPKITSKTIVALYNIMTNFGHLGDENENTEFKALWKDDYLKTLCAFANTSGGTLYIGVDDNGTVIGIDHAKKLLSMLPNKITHQLGIIANVSVGTVAV